MDYQGNYFPEERDENESKIYRTVKGIFKWTMYGISFILYAIIIYLMFANRDSKILERNYMLNDVSNADETQIYQINTRVFMNEDGSLQLYNVNYYEEYNYAEIGVKFNAKKLTDGDYDDCIDYVLSDSNGNTYDLVNKVTDKGGRYGFARICFEDFKIDLNSNDLRYNHALEGSVRPAVTEDKQNYERTETTYELSVYRKSDGELLYKFRLYDNSVTFNSTEYND